jgi:hypothetical protein
MAKRLALTASTRHVSKSQILEKSPKFYRSPVTKRVATDGLAIEVEVARALGRRRFNVLVDQIANRLGTDIQLTAGAMPKLTGTRPLNSSYMGSTIGK